VLVFISLNAVNPIAAYTFCTLWLMRWSAKLNLFFGVPNVNEDWFPQHLQYLSSYIRRKPITVVFPLTLTVAVASELAILYRGVFTMLEPLRFGFFLVASLLALGILEHLFMVFPFRDAKLWNWAKRAADRQSGDHAQ